MKRSRTTGLRSIGRPHNTSDVRHSSKRSDASDYQLRADGTDVAGAPSTLFQKLNALSPTSNWQNEILRAAQTWSNVANVNFGVVSDSVYCLVGNCCSD